MNINSILIVDDDNSIACLLKLLFEGSGYKIAGTASNGQIAIERFRSLPKKPDIILMDYRMPIMNGLEASIEILKIDKHAKIIFTTADDDIKKDALNIGVNEFVSKPFNFNVLMDLISEIVGKDI